MGLVFSLIFKCIFSTMAKACISYLILVTSLTIILTLG